VLFKHAARCFCARGVAHSSRIEHAVAKTQFFSRRELLFATEKLRGNRELFSLFQNRKQGYVASLLFRVERGLATRNFLQTRCNSLIENAFLPDSPAKSLKV